MPTEPLTLEQLRQLDGMGGTTQPAETPTPTDVSAEPNMQPEGYYGQALHLDIPPPEGRTHTVRPQGAHEDLDRFARVMEWVESGGRDVEGPARTPSGKSIADRAQGPMQVTESTARALGADTSTDDWKKGDANRDLGKRQLAQLYSKYQSWDDAAMAYNAGEAKFDKWVADGRPDNPLGKQLRQYNGKVMRLAGVDSPGRHLAQARGTLTVEDLRNLDGQGSVEPDHGVSYEAPDSEAEWLERRKAEIENDPLFAFEHAAMRELVDIPLWAGQVAAQQISPEALSTYTEQINKFDERTAALRENNPIFTFAGKVTGLTYGILGAAGLIKAPEALAKMLPEMSTLSRASQWAVRGAKAAAGGAASMVSQYSPGGDPWDNLWAAPLGAAFGILGLGIGSSVAWATRTVADKVAQSAFLQEIKDAVGYLTLNMTEIKDVIMERLAVNEAKIGQHYGVGGFSASELGAASRAAVEEGKASPEISGIAKKVEDILGVTREAAKRAAWERDMARYTEQMKAFQQEVDRKAGRMAGPTLKARWAERLGGGPARPGPFMATPVAAEDLAKGMQYLRTQWNKSKSDPALRGAIVRLINRLDTEAGEQASAVLGRNVRGQFTGQPLKEPLEAVRSSIEAHFGSQWQTLAGVEGEVFPGAGVSSMKFYEWATKTVERGDAEEIATLRRIMGSSARADAALEKTVLHKMLMDAGPNSGKTQFDPEAIGRYITKHREGLSKVLSRERWEELQGQAKIAERLASLPKAVRHGGGVFGWSGFLAIIGLEHAFRGHPVQGAMLMASGFLAHTLYNVLSRISNVPKLNLLVRQAGRMKPDSKELDATIEKIMSQYSVRYGVMGRVGWQTAQQDSQ